MSKAGAKIRFQRINIITVFLLFVLILAGGVVRSTGSGMGCPDWPKCFDQYVPPTNISELPKDYKKKYADQRFEKNQKFAKTLDFFGYGELARRIREDKSILIAEEFNAAKTWTEYINRLIGSISGLLLLLTAIFSFSYWKENKWIAVLSIFNVVIVGFQGWLGSIVVSTNLVPIIVTVHMLLALAILALCISTVHMSKINAKPLLQTKPVIQLVGIVVLLTSVVQVIFGTEVREKIDAVAAHLQGGYREDWVGNVGTIFHQHREIAIFVIIINAVLYALIRQKFDKHSVQQQLMSFTFLLVTLQIVTGIILSYWTLPPAAQAIHIILASLLFGTQFYLLLNLYRPVNLQEARK